ncbi:MAG: hypothetical protein ACOVRP_01595, partial [Gemmatimonas sp.]
MQTIGVDDRVRRSVGRAPRALLGALTALMAVTGVTPARVTAQAGGRFAVRFPASLNAAPITGRLFVALYQRNDVEPRIAAYQSARTRIGRVPFFAIDVEQQAPGTWAMLNDNAVGYPYWSIRDIPPGDYYAQAVLNVYTRFARADGHTIWAHQDQWEGQRWAFSPGNLISTPVKVRVDPTRG